MEKPKKRGRPKGKTAEETVSIGYRLTVPEFKALEKYGNENDRKVAVETARAVRKYLRELGLIPDKK